MTTTETWNGYLDARRGQYLDEYLDLLRIPSVSALPEHAGDVQRAAQWVAQRITTAGLEHVQILPTGGHPVVYGDWLHAQGSTSDEGMTSTDKPAGAIPTILIYGHFDVQPADPLDLWTTPPFEPTLRDGRVYARGASDDKGNMLTPIFAIEALLRTEGALPVNLKVIFEGQEEIGSPQLPAFIAAHRDLLACDLVVSADSGQWAPDQPLLGIGARGLSGLQIDVRGAKSDLHSGVYGGAVPNSIHALAHILDSLHDAEGKILVEGFYDDVVPLTDADRAQIAAAPFDEAAYRSALGVSALVGEPGYTPLEQLGARPTLEVNGVWGGFQGEGTKTVLPAEAHAKITCRLVPDQDPERIYELVAAHVKRHAPPGVEVTVRALPGKARPYLMPADHWGNHAATDVLTDIYGVAPLYVRSGGSVPVYELFQNTLGVYSVGFGFGLRDEGIHAPNEFFRVESFERGPGAYCRLLHRLGQRN